VSWDRSQLTPLIIQHELWWESSATQCRMCVFVSHRTEWRAIIPLLGVTVSFGRVYTAVAECNWAVGSGLLMQGVAQLTGQSDRSGSYRV
jgi:hypothetical protein